MINSPISHCALGAAVVTWALVGSTILGQENRAPRPETTLDNQIDSNADTEEAGQSAEPRVVTRLIGKSLDSALIERRLQAILGRRLVARPRTHPPRQQNTVNQPIPAVQRVYDLRRNRKPIATLIFDDRRDGVLVEARPRVVQQLEILFTELARSTRGDRPRTFISIERTDPRKLKQAIDAYRNQQAADDDHPKSSRFDSGVRPISSTDAGAQRQVSRRQQRLRGGLALVNFVMQTDDSVSDDADSGANSQTAQDQAAAAPQGAEGGLDLDVEVQTLPDLDVVILRGRDRDVQRLTEIIQELERLSEETQPKIHLQHLKHANSDAVTEVLQEVNEDLTGRRQGRVSVTSLTQPNAILLIGWGEAVSAMRDLIRQLDTANLPAASFRVYRLKHAPASEVASTVTEFFSNRENLGPRVQAVADQRSNSVVAHAAPRDLAQVDQLVRSLDTPESRAVNRAVIVPLKHSLAADLADTLRQAIQPSGDAAAPSAILELMTVDSQGKQLIRSGILADVRVTENVRNNSIVLSGPAESIPLLRQLIEQLDSPGAVSQIKVFRVRNGDANSLVRMLRSLLPSETGGGATTPQLPGAEGETSLAPLRFSVDNRTNSIIATGTEGDLRIIEALLLRLDERDLAERQTEVYRLRNSPAIDVATAVNEFLRSERVIEAAAPGAESPFEQIEREVVVVPEPIGNSLIISATPRYFDEIRDLVKGLDEPPPQVMIQVLIAEITLDNADEFGVELGLQDSILFDRSLLGDLVTTVNTSQTSTASGIVTSTEEIIRAASNVPGFNFNNTPLGNSGSTQARQNSGRVGTQGLSSFDVGRINTELGFGGLVLSASSDSISVLIRALEETSRLEVLSRPQVRTLDNQSAFIQVGQRVPRIVASNITEGGLQTNSVELENVGLILGVTPRISPDGTVVMELDAEKSSLGPEEDGIPITVSLDGTVIRSPRIDTTTAQATVSAANGETVVLGGLITNSRREVHRTVPYLSDVPLLGDLFRYDLNVEQRSELLIILTPHVIRSPEDSERLKQAEMARMSWCAADVYDLTGNLQSTLHTAPLFDEPTEVIYPHVDPRGEGIVPPEPAGELPSRVQHPE